MKNEETKYYKVVTVHRDKNNRKSYWSYLDKNLPENLCVRYKVRQWVEAPIGGLLVFSNLDRAEYWANEYPKELWEVKVQNQLELPIAKAPRYYLSFDRITSIWAKNVNFTVDFWPTGTQAFQKVKLWKRIEISEKSKKEIKNAK